MAPHRHWSLLARLPASNIAIGEIELRDSVGGPDLTGSGTASASYSYYGYVPSKAVDNLNAVESDAWSAWESTSPQRWNYDFGVGNAYDIIQILLSPRATAPAQTPTDFRWQYSDDGVQWTTARRVSGLTWQDGVSQALDVSAVALTGLVVTPDTASVVFRRTTKLTATGTYADANSFDISDEVSWSSSDPAVATVSSNGTVTPVSSGTATITATKGALSDTAVITVSAGVDLAKSVGYAVVTPAVAAMASSKVQAYAVLTTHQSIAGAKLVGYAVVTEPPPGSEEKILYTRVRDRFGRLGPPTNMKSIIRIPS